MRERQSFCWEAGNTPHSAHSETGWCSVAEAVPDATEPPSSQRLSLILSSIVSLTMLYRVASSICRRSLVRMGSTCLSGERRLDPHDAHLWLREARLYQLLDLRQGRLVFFGGCFSCFSPAPGAPPRAAAGRWSPSTPHKERNFNSLFCS